MKQTLIGEILLVGTKTASYKDWHTFNQTSGEAKFVPEK